jgi:hypothetical protein
MHVVATDLQFRATALCFPGSRLTVHATPYYLLLAFLHTSTCCTRCTQGNHIQHLQRCVYALACIVLASGSHSTGKHQQLLAQHAPRATQLQKSHVTNQLASSNAAQQRITDFVTFPRASCSSSPSSFHTGRHTQCTRAHTTRSTCTRTAHQSVPVPASAAGLAGMITLWLDEEWTPLEVHQRLGKAAAKAYATLRHQGGWQAAHCDTGTRFACLLRACHGLRLLVPSMAEGLMAALWRLHACAAHAASCSHMHGASSPMQGWAQPPGPSRWRCSQPATAAASWSSEPPAPAATARGCRGTAQCMLTSAATACCGCRGARPGHCAAQPEHRPDGL